jgi:hypothetical protein
MKIIAWLFVVLRLGAGSVRAEARKPNIVLIFGDDWNSAASGASQSARRKAERVERDTPGEALTK